jgi:hypothetical protein
MDIRVSILVAALYRRILFETGPVVWLLAFSIDLQGVTNDFEKEFIYCLCSQESVGPSNLNEVLSRKYLVREHVNVTQGYIRGLQWINALSSSSSLLSLFTAVWEDDFQIHCCGHKVGLFRSKHCHKH